MFLSLSWTPPSTDMAVGIHESFSLLFVWTKQLNVCKRQPMADWAKCMKSRQVVEDFWRKIASRVVPLLKIEWSFCCIHRSRDFRCFSVGSTTPKPRPPSNTWFIIEPTRLSSPNGISISPAVYAQYISMCNTQTDTQTTLRVTSVAIDLIYATHAMRPINTTM